MKSLIFSFAIIFYGSSTLTYAQVITFEKTFGGIGIEEGYSVQQTPDSGYIIAGVTLSYGHGSSDVYLIKVNSQGDTVWTKTFGGGDVDYGNCVQLTSDMGFILTGATRSFGSGLHDVYLIKTDLTGDTLWTRTYGGTEDDIGHSVQQTSDGGYFIVGLTRSFGDSNDNIYLVRTNSNGDTLWTKVIGGNSDENGKSGMQTIDGGYIILCDTSSPGDDNSDIVLIKTDSNGDILWTKTYGGNARDAASSIQQTMNGGYIIAGRTASFGAGQLDGYVIKTDGNGDTLWTKTFGGVVGDVFHSVRQTQDQGYIFVGSSSSFSSSFSDVYLLKTDLLGNEIWMQAFGGKYNETGYAVDQTRDGGYVIVGNQIADNDDNVYLLKTDSYGNILDVGDMASTDIPREVQLYQNYPNPFNPVTVIRYSLPAVERSATSLYKVHLDVYDVLGRHIATLVNEFQISGYKSIDWNAGKIPSGVYYYQLNISTVQYGTRSETKKMILLK